MKQRPVGKNGFGLLWLHAKKQELALNVQRRHFLAIFQSFGRSARSIGDRSVTSTASACVPPSPMSQRKTNVRASRDQRLYRFRTFVKADFAFGASMIASIAVRPPCRLASSKFLSNEIDLTLAPIQPILASCTNSVLFR